MKTLSPRFLVSLVALFGAAAAGCAPANGPLKAPTVSSTGAPVTAQNETCRVPADAVTAFAGRYTATVKTSAYGTVQMDMSITAETISGYSGQFLKSSMTLSGSHGSSTQVALLCTQVVRSGSVIQGAYLRSEAATFGPFDYIYSGGQVRTDSQFALSALGGGTYSFDPSNSWMQFKDSTLTQTLSASVSGLQKL